MTSRPDSTYTPDLPTSSWERIAAFVRDIVETVQPSMSYPLQAIWNGVAHHVDWAHEVEGLPLDRDILFRRDIIGWAVREMPTNSPSTRGRRRSLLLRVGEVLGVIDVPVPLRPLPGSPPTRPYRDAELRVLRIWAYMQGDPSYAQSAQALLALGLGAGLPTRDLCFVRAVDVTHDATVVHVDGGTWPRDVPVLEAWRGDLLKVVSRVADADREETLFRPGVAFHKNTVVTFVERSQGVELKPSTQRMRSSWLVHHLASGTPMQDLLHWAGVKSMDGLSRYERFLPAPRPAAAAGAH